MVEVGKFTAHMYVVFSHCVKVNNRYTISFRELATLSLHTVGVK